MTTKTAQLHTQITTLIDSLDIAPFIAEEAYHFVDQLNYYKLKKISDQSHVFASYLCALDKENTTMVKQAVQLRSKKTKK